MIIMIYPSSEGGNELPNAPFQAVLRPEAATRFNSQSVLMPGTGVGFAEHKTARSFGTGRRVMSKPSTTYDVVLEISGGYEDLIPKQFADREDERLLIQRRVEAAQTGEVEYPLVEFYGVVGQGKSWLLSYLARQYWLSDGQGPSLEKPTFSAKIDFGVFHTPSHSYSLLQSLTSQIREQLAKAEPELKLPRSLEKDAPPENVDVVAKELAEFVTALTIVTSPSWPSTPRTRPTKSCSSGWKNR